MNLIFRVLNDRNTKLSNKNENKIKKHRRFIQSTSDLKASAIKRKLKNQRGGFWSTLLSTAFTYNCTYCQEGFKDLKNVKICFTTWSMNLKLMNPQR